MAPAKLFAMTAPVAGLPARPARVVRRTSGQIVVILVGDDAPHAAASWRSRGYRVDTIDGLGL